MNGFDEHIIIDNKYDIIQFRVYTSVHQLHDRGRRMEYLT